MIVYSVTCSVEAGIAQEWEQFFLDKHLDDLVKTGCFTGYSFCKILEEEENDSISFRSEYYAPDMEHLERYQQTAATELKQEVADLFAGKYTCSRTIYEVKKTHS